MIDNRPLEEVDPEMAALIRKDLQRQNTHTHDPTLRLTKHP